MDEIVCANCHRAITDKTWAIDGTWHRICRLCVADACDTTPATIRPWLFHLSHVDPHPKCQFCVWQRA